jgi:hypothetical protein
MDSLRLDRSMESLNQPNFKTVVPKEIRVVSNQTNSKSGRSYQSLCCVREGHFKCCAKKPSGLLTSVGCIVFLLFYVLICAIFFTFIEGSAYSGNIIQLFPYYFCFLINPEWQPCAVIVIDINDVNCASH